MSSHEIAFSAGPTDDVLAIGDIHGRADLLRALLETAAGIPRAGRRRTLVLLGDLIDRGPDSLGCLELAMDAKALADVDDVVACMGNHEQMMLVGVGQADEDDLPGRRSAFELWKENGGASLMEEMFGGRHANRGQADVRTALGPDRMGFVRSMVSHHRSGDVVFVHAGLSPIMPHGQFLGRAWDIDLRALTEAFHWAWIREPFLRAPSHQGAFVVHGHTPHDAWTRKGAGTVANDRLNLDVGSFGTGFARMARVVDGSITIYEAIAAEG